MPRSSAPRAALLTTPLTTLLTALLLLSVLSLASTKKIPDYLHVCHKSDPRFDECLAKSVIASKPYLNKGIPKLHVPPYEPLEISTLDVNRNLDNIQIKAHLTNIKIYGSSGFTLDNLKTDLNRLEGSVTIHIPRIYVTTDYNVEGRILIVPVQGFGAFRGNFTDCKAVAKASVKTYNNKKGVKHLKFDKVQLKLGVGDTSFDIENKDSRSAAVANAATTFVTQNRQQVIRIVLPIVEETMEDVLRQIGDDILSTMPFHEILPP